MKKNSILITTILILSLSLLITACSPGQVAGYDLMEDIDAEPWPEDVQSLDEDFIEYFRNFSFKFFNAIKEKSEDENMMISPASVFLALSMTLNGADSDTREEILDVLADSKLSLDDLNRMTRDWIIYSMNTGNDTEFSIANSIWYREEFSANKTFLQQNANFFGADARKLDFNNPNAPREINKWVEKATRGTIDEIIDDIDADAVMFLINAIYFNAKWLEPFLSEDTKEGDFYSSEGIVKAEFMNRIGNMEYLSCENSKGVVLPYNDEKYAFVALLPQEGKSPKDLVDIFDADYFEKLLEEGETKNIDLQLPKFETEFESQLKSVLSSMGIKSAFNPSEADFSLMSDNYIRELYIEDVKHKTFISVFEEGTEAAAVTSVEMRVTSLPVGDIKITFDRPFFYSIIDTETNIPIFIGVLDTP